jgi:nickel-type superoxide dismutase maturation protease
VRWPLVRVKVAEPSMVPAVRSGDWLIALRTKRIKPGQMVIARNPDEPDMLLIKRVGHRVDGGWWVESDNPYASAVDSRRFGPVPDRLVVGRVLARYWPPRHLSRTAGSDTPRPRLRVPAGTGPCGFALRRQ